MLAKGAWVKSSFREVHAVRRIPGGAASRPWLRKAKPLRSEERVKFEVDVFETNGVDVELSPVFPKRFFTQKFMPLKAS
jgi:hypothetical protein